MSSNAKSNKMCAGCHKPDKHVQYTVSVVTNKWITPWHKSTGETWYCCGSQCLDLVVPKALAESYDNKTVVAYAQDED